MLALAFVLVPAATSSPGGSYTASISPNSGVTADDSTSYTLTITNDSLTSDTALGAVTITPPDGAILNDPAPSVTPPSGKFWSIAVVGGVIKAHADTAGDALDFSTGESIDVTVQATLTAAGTNTWTTHADSSNGDFTAPGDFLLTGSDPTVAVTHGALAKFEVSPISDPQTAGTGFTVTATAEDQYGNPLGSDYSGTPSLGATGAGTALHGSSRGCDGGGTPTPGGTNACAASYGNPPSVLNGVATWSGVVGFQAESGRQLTASDSGATGDSNTFEVKHAALQHFTVGSIPSPQTAGTGFPVTATAKDNFDNPLGSDYSGTPSLGATGAGTALHGSSRGCDGGGTPTPGGTNACAASYGNPPSVLNGVATWSGVVGFQAESGRQLTASDSGATGDSNSFVIAPAGLQYFTITNFIPSQPETAGTPFTVDVTAFDNFGNGGANGWTSATKCVVFSGASNSPNIAAAKNPNTPPLYPAQGSCSSGQSALSFNPSGQATASITLYRATNSNTSPTSTNLTVADAANATKNGSTGNFIVNNNDTADDALDFTTQPPPWVQANVSFPVAITVYDQWGNTVPSHNVTMAIDPSNNPNGATLTCPNTTAQCVNVPSNSSGVASFSLKLSKDSTGFVLKATGSPPEFSNAFNSGDQVCNGNCNPKGDDGAATSTTTNVSGLVNGNELAISVDTSLIIPTSALALCSGLQTQVGSGTVFEAVKTTNETLQPSWTVTMSVKKSGLINPARGANLYDVCLGTVNTSLASPFPPPLTYDCQPNPATTPPFSLSYSWPKKGGGCATYDSGTHKFWGNVPDAAPNVKNCSLVRSPLVLSKTKSASGTLQIVFCVPYPWDGWGGGH